MEEKTQQETPQVEADPEEVAPIVPEASKKKYWLVIGLTALVLLLLGTTGFFIYQKYQLKKNQKVTQSKPYPVVTKSSPTPEKSLKEIKIIDGNVCQVTISNEIKILVNKNDYQSESISGFDKVIVSPDETKMCFLGYSPVPIWLYSANVDGGNVTKVGLGENCVWSPDSKKIAFNNHVTDVSPIDILIFDIDSTKVENLTKETAPEGFIRYYEIPQWSGDSTTITANFKSVSMPDETQRESGTSIINLLTKEIVDK